MNSITFFIQHKNALVKIEESKIDHIESTHRFCKIYVEGKFYISNLNISEIQMRLSKTNFIRIGRCYIVPLHKIDTITQDSIIIGKTEITIGRRLFYALMKKVNLLCSVRSATVLD